MEYHPRTEEEDMNDSDGASSLDHVLLESLFYNEMMMLDSASLDQSGDALLSYLSSAEPTASANGTASSVLAPSSPPDDSALAERAMLRDFGVSPSAVAPPPVPPGSNRHSKTAVEQSASWASAESAPNGAAASSHSAAAIPAGVTSGASTSELQVPQERARQLVSQFNALASRLGISLPSNVLSSLTATAAANEARNPSTTTTLTSSLAGAPTATAPTAVPAMQSATATAVHPAVASSSAASAAASSAPPPPVVQQLQSTAEAAIAAVSETRKRPRDTASSVVDPDATATTTTTRPLYSKRRKKPRLSDCEAKLAALKEDNEMLKRHLATVTNRSAKLEQERKESQQEMRRLVKEGDRQKLGPLLLKFSEMYSDYGQHRHTELTFHLEQLEKLVAPTNFTKMGLWTLGQSEHFYMNPKRNPIAGILRRELNITPAQGRKILDQREKIRNVCSNLKQCLILLGKLKGLCEHKQKIFSDRMSKCQEILTPLQVVKLLLWVDEHSHLLESVCPGWESERIRPKDSASKPPPATDAAPPSSS